MSYLECRWNNPDYYCSKHNEKKRDESNSRQIGMTSITFLATIFCGKQQCSRESRRDEWRGYGRSDWGVFSSYQNKTNQNIAVRNKTLPEYSMVSIKSLYVDLECGDFFSEQYG